jgi:LPS sulfotransferase NodH
MNFIILTQARSGSSLLAEMLNSHSRIHCDGEIFNPTTLQKKGGRMALWLAHHFPTLIVWYHQRKRKKEHYGFKLIIGQVKNPEQFIQSLHKKGFIIINLQRNNSWHTALSAAIAVTSQKWYINKPEQRQKEAITIQPDLILSRLAHTIQQNQLQANLIANKPAISVVYESDLIDENKQAVFSKRICNELNLPFEPLKGISIKSNEHSFEQSISNYHELVELIQASEFAHHINH